MSRNKVRSPLLDAGPVLLISMGVLIAGALLYFAVQSEAAKTVSDANEKADRIQAELDRTGPRTEPLDEATSVDVPLIISHSSPGAPLTQALPGRAAAPRYPVGAIDPKAPVKPIDPTDPEVDKPEVEKVLLNVLIQPSDLKAEVEKGVPAIRVSWTAGELSEEQKETHIPAADSGYVLMRATFANGRRGKWKPVTNQLLQDTEFLDLGPALGESYVYAVMQASSKLDQEHSVVSLPKGTKISEQDVFGKGKYTIVDEVETKEPVGITQSSGLLSWSHYGYDRNLDTGIFELHARIELWQWFEPRRADPAKDPGLAFMNGQKATWLRLTLDIKGIEEGDDIGQKFYAIDLKSRPTSELFPGRLFGGLENLQTVTVCEVYDGKSYIMLSTEEALAVMKEYALTELNFETGWKWLYFDNQSKKGVLENPEGDEVDTSERLTEKKSVTEMNAPSSGGNTDSTTPPAEGGTPEGGTEEGGTEEGAGEEGGEDMPMPPEEE